MGHHTSGHLCCSHLSCAWWRLCSNVSQALSPSSGHCSYQGLGGSSADENFRLGQRHESKTRLHQKINTNSLVELYQLQNSNLRCSIPVCTSVVPLQILYIYIISGMEAFQDNAWTKKTCVKAPPRFIADEILLKTSPRSGYIPIEATQPLIDDENWVCNPFKQASKSVESLWRSFVA